MKHDTIQINNETFRVEFNWNATVNFLEHEGLELGDVDDLRKLKPSQITSLIYHGVKEGARMEGKEFNYSVVDFGAKMGVKDIIAMFEIYRAQTSTGTTETKKKMKLFSLKN